MAKKRKVAYRKKSQNRLSMFMVTLVVLVVICVATVGGAELRKKHAVYDQQISELEAKIANEEQRAEEIEEFGKYTQTKKYAEEVAKDKLGLVYEGEIVFREEK